MVVPVGRAWSFTSFNFPPSIKTLVAAVSSSVLVINSTLATEAIEASAGSKMAFRCLLTEVWLRTAVEREPLSDVETFLDKALVRTGP